MKRSIISMVLVLAMVLSVCGSASAAGRTPSDSKAQNALNVAISLQPNSLDPQLFTQVSEDAIIGQVYESLFITNNAGEDILLLAESIVPDETGASAEVTLKSGIKFHSGDTLTAEDVAFTLERCTNSTLCSDLAAYSTIEVVDDTHFVWNFPYAEMGAGYYELSSIISAMMIVNKSFCEETLADVGDNLNMTEDGTGAYMVSNVAVNGDVTVVRFPDYHGTASVDTINYKVITGSQEMAFESGDIDIAMYTAMSIETVKGYDNVATNEVITNNVAFTINNMRETSPMNDRNVREAAVRAMNRADVALIFSDGGATVAYNMATPVVDYYADVCNHYDQDVAMANDLMAQAGYSKSNPCAVELIVVNDPKWVAACEVLKENLEQACFSVNIVEVPDLTRYYTGEFDIAMVAVGLTTSFTSYAMLFDDASGLNLCGISGPEQEEILSIVTAAVDEESAHKAMQAVVDTLGYVPLGYTTAYHAMDADLQCGEFYTTRGDFRYNEFSWN